MLRIETFTNSRGGNAFFKALTHPLAARAMPPLLNRLGRSPIALYDVDGKTVLRHEHQGDRFILLYQSDTFIVARVVLRAGAHGLECYGTHSGTSLTRPDLIGPWLVDVCTTLTLRP